jgi:hypothetical protein
MLMGLLMAAGVSSAQQIIVVDLGDLPLSIPLPDNPIIAQPETATITIRRAQWPLQGIVRFFEDRDSTTGKLSLVSDEVVFKNVDQNAVISFISQDVATPITPIDDLDFLFPFFENPMRVNRMGRFSINLLIPIQDLSGGVKTISVRVSSDVETTAADRIKVSLSQRAVEQPEARIIAP